jgi:hypothetical protein
LGAFDVARLGGNVPAFREVIVVPKEPELVGLSTALDGLREELENAWKDSAGHLIRFRVNEVTLTLEAVVRTDKELGGKIRWWLVEAGAGGRTGTEVTQKLELTLKPGVYGQDGKPAPLDVEDEQARPAG